MTIREKITELIEHLAAYETLRGFKKVASGMFGDDEEEKKKAKEKGEPVLEGISFRFKTVQYHMIDDTFEELKKKSEIFGDLEIYSERFSLPGWGEELEGVSKEEYQFEVTALIKSKVGEDTETYMNELEKVMQIVSEKHGGIDIDVYPTEKYYNVMHIVFHTSKEGVFSKS